MPTEIERYIRFQLEHLTARNEHHTFEEISFRIAERRLSSNLLPATGPVSAGGDQGRDAESYYTSLPQELPGAGNFVARATSEPLVVAASVQRSGLEPKVRSDLKSICGQGERVAKVAFFAVQEIPIAVRHRLQKYAREIHSVNLEIFDGQAVAHMLAQGDLLWVAQRYLDLPSHLVPEDHKGNSLRLERMDAQRAELQYGRVLAPDLAVFRQFRRDDQVIARADASVLVFILEEVIRLGAIDVAVDARRYTNAISSLPAAFRHRVVQVGSDVSNAAVLRMLRPVAEEHQIIFSETLSIQYRTDSAVPHRIPTALIGLSHNLEKLIRGMQYGLQIDINLNTMGSAIRTLLESSKSFEARGNLITIEQIISTYEPHRIGTVVCTSTSPSRLVEIFLELANDPLYRELSENVRGMGIPGQAPAVMAAVTRIAKHLASKRVELRFGRRKILTPSRNLSSSHSQASDIFDANYFPPIVSLANASKRAHEKWKQLEPQFIPAFKSDLI